MRLDVRNFVARLLLRGAKFPCAVDNIGNADVSPAVVTTLVVPSTIVAHVRY
jgi:hypothetical protein